MINDIRQIIPYYKFILIIHLILFKDITSNAGQIRNINDINSGKIYFGGIKQREIQSKYSGSKPELIKKEVETSISYLHKEDMPPLERAMRFYQKFVYCHPFYDANGRIARFIVSVFLFNHGKVIDWEPFLDKSHFYKRLNRCHDRVGQPQQFEEYFMYLLNFVSKYEKDTEELKRTK